MRFLCVVFSSVLRKFPPAGTLGPVYPSLFFIWSFFLSFFNKWIQRGHAHRDTGFWSLSPPQFLRAVGHPTTNWKRKCRACGGSVRFPSLSPPALAIDAVKSTLWSRHAFSVPTSLCQPFPSLFCPPSLLPGLLEAGLPARPPGFLSPEASPNLVCYKEIPWMRWRPSAPGQQDSALLRAAGVCCTRGQTCSERFLCQEALDPGPGISRAKPMSTWAEGPHPSGLLPSLSLGGCCSLQSVLVARPPFPTSRTEQSLETSDPFL